MATIKILRVDTTELSHPARQVRLRCFYLKMIVIAHQTPGMANPVTGIAYINRQRQKSGSICIGFDYRFTAIAAGCDVVERALEFQSKWSCHDR